MTVSDEEVEAAPTVEHAINELCDCAVNIIQGLKNVRDGYTVPIEAIKRAEANYAYALGIARKALEAAARVRQEGVRVPFQARVAPWMQECFGPEISADRLERNDRFMEEALELVQASGFPKERAYALIEYVYGRDQGEINQEVGGVMVTLAAHCLAHGVDMHEAGETELARIWTKVDKIRAKQAAKPTGSALPIASPIPSDAGDREAIVEECARIAEQDDRSPLAREHGYEPEWYRVAKRTAQRIRALAKPAPKVEGEMMSDLSPGRAQDQSSLPSGLATGEPKP